MYTISASGKTRVVIERAAERANRLQPMVAVRRPVDPVRLPDRDHRVQEPAHLVDHGAQAADVQIGGLALEGARLDPLDRQRGEQDPAPAEGIAIGCEHRAAVCFHLGDELLDRGRRLGLGLLRVEALRLDLFLFAAAGCRSASSHARECKPGEPHRRVPVSARPALPANRQTFPSAD